MAGRLLLSLPLCIKGGYLPWFQHINFFSHNIVKNVVVVSSPELTKAASALAVSKPSYLGRQMPTYLQHRQ
ncbi:hypothetical protein CsSME_00051375 [Camellia sinensis var. sinensis]